MTRPVPKSRVLRTSPITARLLLTRHAPVRIALNDGRLVFGDVTSSADPAGAFTLAAWGCVEPMVLALSDVRHVAIASVTWAELVEIKRLQKRGEFPHRAHRGSRGDE